METSLGNFGFSFESLSKDAVSSTITTTAQKGEGATNTRKQIAFVFET